MFESKTRGIIIGAIFGIAGVVIGSVGTGLMNIYVQERQQRSQAMLDSFKFDQSNYPIEYLQIKQFIDELRNLSIASRSTIARLVQVQKKYPGCTRVLTDNCRAAYVDIIQAMRDDLGSGSVSAEDIDILLRGKYETAQQALQRLSK